MPHRIERDFAEHYVWGAVCDGWRLVDRGDLSVIEERVPPHGAEEWHVHERARQFFYVLEGHAVMQTSQGDVALEPRTGVEIEPGLAHRFTNAGPEDVRFLVISAPSTRSDRVPA
ncbi:cupin domain-containing protein [Microbacterium faecale]|nr:cupin domain-containing protein [Microbacterium faecale]